MRLKEKQNIIEKKLIELNIIYKPFIYNNSHSIIKYKCKQCGEWKESRYSNLIRSLCLCRKCQNKLNQNKQQLTQEDAENKLNEIGIEYKPFFYTKNNIKIEYRCKNCGKWKTATFNNILKGNLICIECRNKKIKTKQLTSQQKVEEKLNNYNIKYKPFIYKGYKITKLLCECKNCKKYFEVLYSSILKGNCLCNNCNIGKLKKINTYNQQEIEEKLTEFISQLGFQVEKKKFSWGEIDCFIPSLNIGFEYNGCYWHSEFQKDKNYHYDKVTNAQNDGIRVIMIWES